MALRGRWRADSGVWQDAGHTTAAVNGGGLAYWQAAEGSTSNDLIQASAALQPTYNSNDGGYPSVYFDGTEAMQHPTAWTLSGGYAFVAAVKIGAAANNQGLFMLRDMDIGFRVISVISASNPSFVGGFLDGFYTTSPNERALTVITGSWIVLGGTISATQSVLYCNTQSIERCNISGALSQPNAGLILGSRRFISGSYLNTYCREFAIWDAPLTEAELKSEVEACMARWGVTNTVPPLSSGSGVILIQDAGII